MQEKIGFIGLGNMGKPMAVNLAKAGLARPGAKVTCSVVWPDKKSGNTG